MHKIPKQRGLKPDSEQAKIAITTL